MLKALWEEARIGGMVLVRNQGWPPHFTDFENSLGNTALMFCKIGKDCTRIHRRDDVCVLCATAPAIQRQSDSDRQLCRDMKTFPVVFKALLSTGEE